MSEWSVVIQRALQGLADQAALLLPRLVVSFLLLMAGVVFAFLLQSLVRTVLQRAGLDRLADQTGIGRFLARMGSKNPASHFAGFVVFWTVLAVFLVTAADALLLPAVSEMIGGLIAQIPPVALAALVLLLGMSFARHAQRTIEGVTERSRMASARSLGLGAYYLVTALTIVVALSGLGIDFTIVTAVVVVVLASLGVGVAVTLGIGSRDVARNTISGVYARRDIRVGDRIRVDGLEGEVAAVGQVLFTLRDGERTWLVPYDRIFAAGVEVVSRARR